MHIQLQLKAVKTRTELATKLGVDIKSLNLVSFTSSKCNDVNCNLPAVNGNYGNCILHQQTWYPRKLTTTGEEAINCRGHGLYGPQFMRTYNNKTQKKTCCCNSKLCEEIGYSHQGMMHLPTKEDECKEALRVMGIAACDRQEIWDNRSDHRVAYWHYNQRHLMMGSNGKYKFRKRAKYYDDDNKEFTCPPPNNKIEHYIDQIKNENGYIRGGYDDSLPSWYKSMAKLQVTTAEIPQSKTNNATTPRRNGGSNKVPRVVTPTSATSPRGKRSSPESSELEELREQARLLQAQLNSALDCIEGLTATVELKDEEMIRIKFERDNLLEENAELKAKIEKIEQQKCYISYDDLRTGGKLSEFVNDFTFFPSFDSVDAFLGVINYTEGCKPGDGLCENLRRYSKISVAERKKYNDSLKNGTDTVDETAQDGDDDAMSISSDAGTGLSDIADEAMEESDSNGSAGDTSTSPRSRRRKLSWKDEFLVYCFYAKCNLSMRRTGALFGIKQTLVHDIVYAWANVLCLTLEKLFPVPTRSQILRAYPKSMIKKFGHANIFMLLDATEAYADIASMKSVNAILYSAYKGHSTLKWLVGCDPIGTVWNESISAGYPGSVSDIVCTAVTNILDQIPFGCAVEVDKGFLIENDCALLGIICIRPMKLLNGQTQQSKEDVALTQKVGKTRIVIEQANGQFKRGTGFFDRNIRIDQIGLADLIFRSGYLLTNFMLGFIQGRDNKATTGPRHCKAKVRYYEGTDDGLIDVRPMIELWGLESEIARWHELISMPSNAHLTRTEISELVLDEDWPSKLRKEHIADLGL